MKLDEDVLLEIVDIVRKGLIDGVDISDLLREMDLFVEPDSDLGADDKISLTRNHNP